MTFSFLPDLSLQMITMQQFRPRISGWTKLIEAVSKISGTSISIRIGSRKQESTIEMTRKNIERFNGMVV
jgi:hypothetical protein